MHAQHSDWKPTIFMALIVTSYVFNPTHPPTVKRYVRKGIPNEYRALIWMAASGSQEQMEKNPGYYHSLLHAQHDPTLVETIRTGWYDLHFMIRRQLSNGRSLKSCEAAHKSMISNKSV